MTAAWMPSRRKMFSKVRVTLEVPAPLEPVMATMGCLWDMGSLVSVAEQAASAEQRRGRKLVHRLVVVALDAFDLVRAAEHQADALV